ncbi:MAG: ADP-ribosylglycohydrolase family protein [Armatimonadota bacterium]|nr:ADP-ribosylglycohydrolase family protein [Armatimonadota bacterium]
MTCFVVLLSLVCSTAAPDERKLSLEELKDHIAGGWVGQGVGVTFADAYEFKACGERITGDLRKWQPQFLERSLRQDDLYVDVTFIDVLKKHGLQPTIEQAERAFAASEYPLWHANRAARDNIRRGIMPPLSGHPKYNLHADDIDFQIECDGFGLICPGLPQQSNEFCELFGHIMNYGDAVYSGMWIAGMYALGFFESDVKALVERALGCVPPESRFAKCIRDVISWYARYPDDWTKTWEELERKYQDDVDCCPGRKANIDAVLNAAYVAIALLYGGADMAKTMEIATRCGQDSDCNAASACGVLGCMIGISKMDENYKSYLPKLADRTFAHTDYTYQTLIDTCVELACKVVEAAGGKIVREGNTKYLRIPEQRPTPPVTFEQWPLESQKRMLRPESK